MLIKQLLFIICVLCEKFAEEKKDHMFGPHLMLDLYGCDRKKLLDVELAHKILDELPGRLGMNKIMPPYVIPYKGSDAPGSFDKGGISGVVIIAESHISLHSFVEQEYINIDIFSCKEFDVQKAIDHLVEAFGAKRVEKRFVMRGKEFEKFPASMKTAMKPRKMTVKGGPDMQVH
jgi:S-adenosylmethionine decarboxylase